MSECNHNCSTCSEKCDSREQESLLAKPNKDSKIKKIIGIVSGKGGVGKSLVTSMLAAQMNKKGYKIGVLDADITGPSIPKAFGLTDKIVGDEEVMYPSTTGHGTKIMSINLLLDEDTKPVVWRGPILANAVKQFYSDTNWGEVDYLFVDMPPGTADVPLTVFQSLPLDGIVIVSSPQDLVSMIVGKAVHMANMMKVKIVGVVENMAYIKCPCCENKIYPFGVSKIEDISQAYGLKPLASLPIDPLIATAVDNGKIEEFELSRVDSILNEIIKL